MSKLYCWMYDLWSDPYGEDLRGALNFASTTALAMATNVEEMSVGESLVFDCSPLPSKNPRHLDFPARVIADPARSFQRLTITCLSGGVTCARLSREDVDVFVPNDEPSVLAEAIRESDRMGYFADNCLPIKLYQGSGDVLDTMLVLWGTHGEDVIYY